MASPSMPATPILTTPAAGATEESYRRRFLLHHRHPHSHMLLPPPATTTPVGVAQSYGLPRPSITPAAAGVAAPADRKKNSMSILQQTSSPLVINSIPDERHCPNFHAK